LWSIWAVISKIRRVGGSTNLSLYQNTLKGWRYRQPFCFAHPTENIMPKTQFIDGQSLVTAAFLNKMYRTDGGHKHDGADADGHASKIDLRTEITAGPNGSVTIPVDTADLHVIQHDHAASGNAIIKTDALTLNGAPRDATRRAQAPLDRSLYVQNAPKMVARLTWEGINGNTDSGWIIKSSYNLDGSLTNETISGRDGYVLTPLDGSQINGVVEVYFSGTEDYALEVPANGGTGQPFIPMGRGQNNYRALARWDATGGRLELLLLWCEWTGSPVIVPTWKVFRTNPPNYDLAGFADLNIVVW
jgi:hypothetical protein